MGIEAIKGVGPATVKKLDKAGIRSLADVRSMDTETISKRTGIPKKKLDEWRMEARIMKVLDDVKGIGPATKQRLSDAGIHSLEDLAKASAQQVAESARVAKERAGAWQKDAQRLLQESKRRVEKESKALAKRGSRLKEEVREGATKAAVHAEDAVRSARSGTKKAVKRGRKAADELVTRVQATTSSKKPEAPSKPDVRPEAAGEVDVPSTGPTSQPDSPPMGTHQAGGTHGTNGTNGSNGANGHGGIFTRLKRIFQVR
jgi:nucleotidyltransferase/DNA polymerase involved in DNA repair